MKYYFRDDRKRSKLSLQKSLERKKFDSVFSETSTREKKQEYKVNVDKMVLTKQYLKYKHSSTFNIIASSRSNGVFIDFNNTSGRYFASGAVENVFIWDLR